MADKNVVVNIQTDASATVNSMKSIKQEIKSLQGAALQGNQDAIKRIAELKDKIEDLSDATKTLKGSGVEKVTSSFGLLGQGFKDFDFDKIKTGFKGIGSAMSAIPIFLVAEGVAYLVENWKELGEGNGIVAKGIQLLNKAFDEITGTITTFTDMIGLSNSALDKQGEAIEGYAEKSKEALSGTTAEFDRQLRVAKAAGKSTVELEIAKQQAIIDTNVQIAKQIEAFVRAGGELDAEKAKLLTASLEAIKGAKVTEFEIEQGHTKKLNEEYKKRKDDKEKSIKDSQSLFDQVLAEEIKKQDDAGKIVRDEKERKAKEAEQLELQRAKLRDDMRNQEIALEKKANEEKVKGWEDAEKKKDAAQMQTLENWKNATIATQGLSDMVFAIRLAKAQKGSAEEEKLARRQFEINKGLQLATAAINGAQSILAITTVPDFTLGVSTALRIAAQVGLTAGTIAKIASTKFSSSGGGGDTSAPSIPSGISGGNTSAPNTQAPSTGSIQPFTRLDENGNNLNKQPIKTYVVESEITGNQKRVGRLEGQASFG